MSETKFNVLCIGNAIVDILSQTTDDFLNQEKLTKGSMRLIDQDEGVRLYDAIGPAIEASGGSAANTAAGVASLGGKAAYFGSICVDELGKIYRHDLTSQGVHFETPAHDAKTSLATGRSIILITPDGERTMNTFLGAANQLTSEDIDQDVVAGSQVTYFEGYLWDPPLAKEAIVKAADIAHQAGQLVAMSLSDSFCVDRYRAEFIDLMANATVDIVFANEDEVLSLYETDDFELAVRKLGEACKVATITRGSKGAIAIRGSERAERPAEELIRGLIDTTGAGDLYASGFLHAFTQGMDLETCIHYGNICAAHVLGHIGPRPQTELSSLI